MPRSLRTDALSDLRDDLVGNIKSVSFVEMSEMVDRHQHKSARTPEAHCFVECSTESFRQINAIELTGQRIEFRPLFKPALAFMPLIDRAYDAVCTIWLSIGAGKPAARVLKPDLFVTTLECILNLIGHALARVLPRRLLDNFGAA